MSEKNESQVSTSYSIGEIKVHKFNLREISANEWKEFDAGQLKLTIGFNFNSDVENNIFVVHLMALYTYPFQNDDEEIFDSEISVGFEFDNLSDVVEIQKDGGYNIEDNLVSNFLSVTIGTARGVIFTRTQNSFINKFYLPILDIDKILNDLNLDFKKIQEENNLNTQIK